MVDALNLMIIQTNYKWNTKKIYNNYVLNFKVNQLKFIMNGSISFRV